MNNENSLVITLDAGGTMTDCLIVDENGNFTVGKALTNRSNEGQSFIESVRDAAGFFGLTEECLAQTITCCYAGTAMLNTLLTRTGRKVGLLVTKGFEDYLLLNRGHSWLGLSYTEKMHQVLRWNEAPVIPHRMIRGITERIGPSGQEVIPVYKEEARKAVDTLLDLGVEVVGVWLLWSHVNPAHEEEVARIVAERARERGKAVEVLVSSQVSPMMREYSRLNSLIIEAYAASTVRKQLIGVEERARSAGYQSRLLTMLSYGGLVNIDYPRMYETLLSGPVGGLTGAKFVGDYLGLKNIVACDMGGTSFDVGIITDGMIPVVREPVFAKRMLNLPMVYLDSIGAGAGSLVKVDPVTKHIEIGPESAGSDVGVCFRSPALTVTDCNLVAGYIDPDYFLGGKVKLDRQKALEEVSKAADTMGTNPYDFASGVVELVNSMMRDQTLSMLLARGYNPTDYTVMAYGGAGPLHMWGFTRDIPFAGICTFPWAAAFSAFGVSTADYMHRYHRPTFAVINYGASAGDKVAMGEALNATWAEMEKQAYEEFAKEGFGRERVSFTHYAYIRYNGQLDDFETVSPVSRINSAEDMDRLIEAFDHTYGQLFPSAMKFPEAGYLILELSVVATVKIPKSKLTKGELAGVTPEVGAIKGKRQIYHERNWIDFTIYEMDRLLPGNVVTGPAVVEHPMTTLVIPPGHEVSLDEYRVCWYR